MENASGVWAAGEPSFAARLRSGNGLESAGNRRQRKYLAGDQDQRQQGYRTAHGEDYSGLSAWLTKLKLTLIWQPY